MATIKASFNKDFIEKVVNRVNSQTYDAMKEFSARVLFEFGNQSYLMKIFEGKIMGIKENPDWTNGWDFSLRGPREEWIKFMTHVPLHNDLFACLRRGFLKLEGNVDLAMSNIRALTTILEVMREEYEEP